MKRIDVVTVGLTVSDRLLIGAFLELIALTDGHVFRLSDSARAPIVIVNPGNIEAAALLRDPQRGVAYIQYGMPQCNFSRGVWRLGVPVRLGALREIMVGIIEQRREWKFSGALTPEAEAGANSAVSPVPAHRKLEQVLTVLEGAVHSRIPHAFSGISGVEIMLFPQTNAVYIQCDPSVSSWQKALVDTHRSIVALAHIGARAMIEIRPITVAHFRWELARHLSAGMLLPGLASMKEFGLTRWPDFGTMTANSGYDLRIVALIATRPTSIAGMLKTVPYSREGIIALLNACALIGCVRDAPEDLLRSVEAQKASAVLSSIRATPAINHSVSSLPTQKPQRGFAGMLSKLRAALSFVPKAIT